MLGPEAQPRVLSDFTHKVFQVGEVAVATYGWAFLDGRNIAGHMAQFVASEEAGTPEETAERLRDYFKKRIEDHLSKHEQDAEIAKEGDQLGFLVAGYDSDVGRTYDLLLPSGEISQWGDTVEGTGAAWRGQTDVIQRLIKGVDIGVLSYFAEEDGLVTEVGALQPLIDKLEYVIPFGSMNLQDAIDFAVFCIRTTIDAQRLTYGYSGAVGSWPGVGGPIEIAAVRGSGFEWVQRTTLTGERPAGLAEI